ncbi:WD-repeat protein, putative [Ixodes scapularis]|uniref:WD-repeat protein, putative n=1 Tax=Ixodes scapularis TaxID=6945 RepID=B7PEJ7_IXOSC|nr:WD-repeat protein, putative [Ixodes scapularis]|eukprot:XP_002433619.1 WD-repeat protein, putative [Ixodes scapularis]
MLGNTDSSRIFQGYRALGYVCNHVPFILRYIQRRKEHLVITSIGRSFHTYGVNDVTVVVSICSVHEDEITCIAGDARLVYTSCGNTIYSWRRGSELQRTYERHESKVTLLLPFGKHLVSVDEAGHVIVWEIKTAEVYLELSLEASTFGASALLHPVTYVNKLLLGSHQGTLQLWNIRSGTLVHSFEGWGSGVTALEQASRSPAVDVVAIGLANGQVMVHNLKFDETLMTFQQDWGPVTAISFRTDGHSQMATGSPLGHVAVWDLEKRRLDSQLLHAHQTGVTGLRFLPDEPLLLTSSPDNSLRMWIFDQSDGGGRLLKQQQGHSGAPCRIRFHGASGNNILSAGNTLRCFSTIGDHLNKSLGQASFDRKKAKKHGVLRDPGKMPPVTEFTSETTREKEWDSVAACHRGLAAVTTWSYDRCCMGSHRLMHDRFKGTKGVVALCVSLSSCGNFVTVGCSTGHVDRFNIQSGIHRMTYGKDTAHGGPVRGVVSDALNQLVATGGADSHLCFWGFRDGRPLSRLSLDSPVAKMNLHRESGMLAVATDDFAVCVVDVELRRVVRAFASYFSSVTDMTFSPDARWLVTSSMDALVRTWDLPSGCLVDCFEVPSPVTSLDLSPTGEYLATTHVDDLGVYLWCNATLYGHVTLQPLPADYVPKVVELPATTLQAADGTEEVLDDGEDMEVGDYESPDQISADMVTLSKLPYSRWQNLLNIEVVKQRNKPKEPPQAPKAAPFFLPTSTGLDPKFALPEDKGGEVRHCRSAGLRQADVGLQSDVHFRYIFLLLDTPVLERLKELGPSSIDFEIRGLSPESGGSAEAMLNFLRAMTAGLRSRRDFELIQSYLGLFLKIHADALASEAEFREVLESLSKEQQASWMKLEATFNQSLCIVNYLRSAVL